MNKSINELKQELAVALQNARDAHDTATHHESQELSNVVVALQKAISDAICEGANPCPRCANPPIGIEQPNARGGVEYEIGCGAGCEPFADNNGTMRQCRVRGGMMPKHTVEAWNAGPYTFLQAAKVSE